jgi:DNA processing protein
MWLQVRNKLYNWLALHRSPGVGPIKFKQCLLEDNTLNKLPSWVKPDWKAVEKDLQWQQQEKCHILTLYDNHYPNLLRKISNPPPILFVQGDITLLQSQQIAIVGSRYPSHEGVDIAYNFAKHFAQLNFTITSGLALGIDTSSHNGALSCGKTIAILGCGLNQIYPQSNKNLASKIIKHGGALVSEFPIGTEPKASNFPKRNRIISGLSLGVIVVEATVNSGALITAKIAVDQGREVFAIPGSIHNVKTKGCHSLIKQGAKLTESINDVLEELNLFTVTNYEKEDLATSRIVLEPEYVELLSYINRNTTAVDEIIFYSKRSAQEVNNILIQLELKGYITAVPGGYVKY